MRTVLNDIEKIFILTGKLNEMKILHPQQFSNIRSTEFNTQTF